MIEHDGCTNCKYFSTTICVPEESPCFDCKMAHNQGILVDKYEPMTNADRIREMSNGELSSFIQGINCIGEDNVIVIDNNVLFNDEITIMEWLQEKVVESDI